MAVAVGTGTAVEVGTVAGGSDTLSSGTAVAVMADGSLPQAASAAIPTLNRLVRLAMALATTIGAESTERSGLKCISPSQTKSRPVSSARSIRSNASRKASA